MVFDLHGHALDLGVERRPFRNRPGEQNPFPLEPEVVVQMGSPVLLDHIDRRLLAPRALLLLSRRLRSDLEAAFAAIFL